MRDARRRVGIAKNGVTEGDQVKLQRSMRERGMLIAAALIEQPRKVGVLGLIMAHNSHAKIGKSADKPNEQDEAE